MGLDTVTILAQLEERTLPGLLSRGIKNGVGMSLLKTLLMGRENGIRAGIRKSLFGASVEDTSPGSSFSAPQDPPAPEPAEAALGLKPEPPRDVIPPEGFEVVLHREALKPGKVAEIIIGGKAIAVANVGGKFHACVSSCPHADGPLGDGSLQGSILSCPYHGWEFDLTDGSCKTNPETTLGLYDVKIVGDAVCVRL
jgi:nitrite reductase/ring-hydroxylating ferredoxin subunit